MQLHKIISMRVTDTRLFCKFKKKTRKRRKSFTQIQITIKIFNEVISSF